MEGYGQIVLAPRPKGLPTPSHFSLPSPSDNQILTGRNLGKTLVRIGVVRRRRILRAEPLERSIES
jgi:hypothetical protein